MEVIVICALLRFISNRNYNFNFLLPKYVDTKVVYLGGGLDNGQIILIFMFTDKTFFFVMKKIQKTYTR